MNSADKIKHELKQNSIRDYVVLVLIGIMPVLSIIAFVFYFYDVRNSMFHDFIGIVAAITFAAIMQIALGFKEILRCFAFSFTWVGLFCIIIKPIPGLIIFTLGLILWYAYKKIENLRICAFAHSRLKDFVFYFY